MKKKKRLNFQEYTCDYVIADELGVLNEKFIKWFIDLHTHYSVIDDGFFVSARHALSEQYAAELALLQEQSRAKTNMKFYLAEQSASALGIYSVKRRFRWRDSQTKSALDARIAREAAGEIYELNAGIEPNDIFADFIDRIADEFVPAIKYKRFISTRRGYITWLVTEFAQDHSIDDILNKLVSELIPKRKEEKFIKKNGEYLKSLISELMPYSMSDVDSQNPLSLEEVTDDSDIQAETDCDDETYEGLEEVDEPDELEELDELEEDLNEPEVVVPEADETEQQEIAAEPTTQTEEESGEEPDENDAGQQQTEAEAEPSEENDKGPDGEEQD